MNKESKTIHLVEDDDALQQVYAIMLEIEGYTVSVSSNGQEAIDYLDDQDVDLIMLDLFMPVLDGAHVLRWLREEKKSSTPVLVLSSMTDDAVRRNILASGANMFVNKPAGCNTIINSVASLLKQ